MTLTDDPFPSRVDVLVAGAGIVGLALALLLLREGGRAVRVAVADPAPDRVPAAARAYTITPSARAVLERLGLWPDLAGLAEPVRSMRITDSRLHDPVRSTFLTFGEGDEPLAHVVGEAELIRSLRRAATAAGLLTIRSGVKTYAPAAAGLRVGLADGQAIDASLLVAADGALSPVRERAGIPVVTWNYRQTGLVAIVAHERPHDGVAVQHFLPGGPFAILPMTGNRSSIVWTEERAEAEAMLTLRPDDLAEEIDRRFGAYLGPLMLATPLAAFPIRFLMARRYAGERVALVGDAAHVIHPLAGQGLNLGLEDAAALASRILDAARLGLDAGDATALAAFERDRRAAVVAMGIATDLLNRLFSNDLAPARLARDFGLGLVERSPGLKAFFMRRAAGHSAAGKG